MAKRIDDVAREAVVATRMQAKVRKLLETQAAQRGQTLSRYLADIAERASRANEAA
jgi:hypothetical protein